MEKFIISIRVLSVFNIRAELIKICPLFKALEQESDFVPLKDPRGFKNFPVASLCKSHEFVTVFC